MLTQVGMRKMKGHLVKAGIKGDTEWNAIIQEAVRKINRLSEVRFPSSPSR